MFTITSAPAAAWVTTGPVGAPRVLAHREPDLETGDREQRTVDGRRHEVALLVEHRVVRQQVLAVDAPHLALRAQRRACWPVRRRRGLRVPDHRGGGAGTGRDLGQRLGRVGHEGGPEQQVLGRVAGDRELGERHEVGVDRGGPVVGLEDARLVAVEVTDDEVELRGRDPDARHGTSLWGHHLGSSARSSVRTPDRSSLPT